MKKNKYRINLKNIEIKYHYTIFIYCIGWIFPLKDRDSQTELKKIALNYILFIRNIVKAIKKSWKWERATRPMKQKEVGVPLLISEKLKLQLSFLPEGNQLYLNR